MVLVWCTGFLFPESVYSPDFVFCFFSFLCHPFNVKQGGCNITAWSPPAGWATVSPHPFGKKKKKKKKKREREREEALRVQLTAPRRNSPPTQLRKMMVEVVVVEVAGRPC